MMRYLKNRAYLREPLQDPQVLFIFAQLCIGLKHYNDRGLTYDTLMPKRILVKDTSDPEGKIYVKVGDMSPRLLRPIDENMGHHHMMNELMKYMAPEVYDFGQKVPKTDIWPLGAVMFSICDNGEPLFFGRPNQIKQAMKNNCQFRRIGALIYRSQVVKDILEFALIRQLDERPSIEDLLAQPGIVNLVGANDGLFDKESKYTELFGHSICISLVSKNAASCTFQG